MTQTLTPAPTTDAMTAIVENVWHGGTKLHLIPMQTPEVAREEFGATLADAEVFIRDTTCTECGWSGQEVKSGLVCQGCGISGCRCLLSDDAHADDVLWCRECQPDACGCRNCLDD